MYTFLIIFIITLIICVRYITKTTNNIPKFMRIIGAFFLSLTIGMVFLLLFSIIVSSSTQEWSDQKHISIYSMSSGSETSGEFFLGSGSINEVGVYFYYRRSGIGYIKKHINSDGTIIVQNGSKSPRIEWREKIIKKNHILSNWVIPSGEKSNYIIYVPENSIKRKFNFN